MKIKNLFKFFIAIVVSESAGAIGYVFTAPAIDPWYAALTKPAFNPPAWVFAPVWALLYFLMGVAAYLIWVSAVLKPVSVAEYATILKKERVIKAKALAVFGFQLGLNAIWSILFFGLRSPFWALIDIIALWLAIIWTIVRFYKISHKAAYLLLPYIFWVSFAAYLNFSIWQLNA